MKNTPSEASPRPAVHRENLRQQLSVLIDHLQADVGRVDEPRFQVLLETSTEVVKGLRTAFDRYDVRQEASRTEPPGGPPEDLPEAPPSHPQPADPAEVAAKTELRKKEARTPKRPHGKSAPQPPPQSGKPLWDRPHSS